VKGDRAGLSAEPEYIQHGSPGKHIQRAFPSARVVKTLNTLTAALVVEPRQLADGDHHIFVSGDDAAAKAQVTELLKSWFG
jgi:predicted dinucleotide-binding enzyme